MIFQKTLSFFGLFLFWTASVYGNGITCLKPELAHSRGCARALAKDSSCSAKFSAYHDDSCILDQDEKAIDQILRLTNADEIPKEILTTFPLEKIARNLVLRSYYKQLKEVESQDIRIDAWPSIQIQIAFQERNFENIINSGFLNQFQTGHSNGIFNFEKRNDAERIFNGTWIEKIVSSKEASIHFLRPKYGFAAISDSQNGYFGRSSYFERYGNVLAQLKPHLKKRSTVTAEDSLSVTSPWNKDVRMTPIGGPKQTAGLFRYTPSSYYFEAQVYGPVTIDDVDFLLLGCYNEREIETVLPTLQKMLEKRSPQTRIFSCQADPKQNKAFMPHRLLYPLPNAQSEVDSSEQMTP